MSALSVYNDTSYQLSEKLTKQFSSSFSASSRLFSNEIRRHIYAIYGLVRIADEIVDSYGGVDAEELLADLYEDVQRALRLGYSANPIVQSYVLTARKFSIDNQLLVSFFDSMALDLSPKEYTDTLYKQYIYGSAEVIGLMCLSVFVRGVRTDYNELKAGARALGSAYQKVNFLRDMKADFTQLGRVYFPDVRFDTFSEADKSRIISDIENDFRTAATVMIKLPPSSRLAVATSYSYYRALLDCLKKASVEDIKQRRLSVPQRLKIQILITARCKSLVGSK